MPFLTRRLQAPKKPKSVNRICRKIIKSREGVSSVDFSEVIVSLAEVPKVTHILRSRAVSAHATCINLSGVTCPNMESLGEILKAIQETCTLAETVDLSHLKFQRNPSKQNHLSELFSQFIRSNKVVVALNLSNNNLGDEGIGMVAGAVAENFKLQTVDLGKNNVKDNEDALILVASLLSRNAPGGDVSVRLVAPPFDMEVSSGHPGEYEPAPFHIPLPPALEDCATSSCSRDDDDVNSDFYQRDHTSNDLYPIAQMAKFPVAPFPSRSPSPLAPPTPPSPLAPPTPPSPLAAPVAAPLAAPLAPPAIPSRPLPREPLSPPAFASVQKLPAAAAGRPAPPSYEISFGTTHDSSSRSGSTSPPPIPPTNLKDYLFVDAHDEAKTTSRPSTAPWGKNNKHHHNAPRRNNNIYRIKRQKR